VPNWSATAQDIWSARLVAMLNEQRGTPVPEDVAAVAKLPLPAGLEDEQADVENGAYSSYDEMRPAQTVSSKFLSWLGVRLATPRFEHQQRPEPDVGIGPEEREIEVLPLTEPARLPRRVYDNDVAATVDPALDPQLVAFIHAIRTHVHDRESLVAELAMLPEPVLLEALGMRRAYWATQAHETPEPPAHSAP
jgi:hypothetical protein